MGNEFSVLMLVYGGDRPAHFDAALRSIAAQTLPPAEIVLVVDGPVPDGTEEVIRKYEGELASSVTSFRVIRSGKNLGCGGAKRLGFGACSYPLVAMMDADDPENTNGGSQNFKPYHTEDAGFNTDAASADSTVQTFTFTGGNYTGNIYNASGSDGLEGTTLNVTFGEGTEYTGAIASTSAIHVTYDGSVAVKESGGYAFDDTEEAAAFAAPSRNTGPSARWRTW